MTQGVTTGFLQPSLISLLMLCLPPGHPVAGINGSRSMYPHLALSQEGGIKREPWFGCVWSREPLLLPAGSWDQATVGCTTGSSTQGSCWDSADFLMLELLRVAGLVWCFQQPGALSSPPQGMWKCTTVAHMIMCGLALFARAANFLLFFLI